MTAIEEIKKIAGDMRGYLAGAHNASGRKFVGVMHPIVPQEILYAAGLHPFRLFPFPGEQISLAHTHLHVDTSSIFRAIWDQVLKGQFSFLDGVVLPESCETVSYFARGWRYHRPGDFVATTAGLRFNKTKNALDFFAQDLRVLASTVSAFAGTEISTSSLASAIRLFNDNRKLLQQIGELRKSDSPLLTGLEAFQIFMASHVMDKADNNKLLEKLLLELQSRKPGPKPRARILVSGPCVVDFRILAAMEESGALIVADDTNFGSRSFSHMVEEGGDPYTALAGGYTGISCPFSISVEHRLSSLLETVSHYKVEGVIFAIERACESEKMDFPYLERELKARNIPVIFIETEYLCNISPIQTRIDGFVESITR